jgi:hypothetical protein
VANVATVGIQTHHRKDRPRPSAAAALLRGAHPGIAPMQAYINSFQEVGMLDSNNTPVIPSESRCVATLGAL